MIRFIFVWLRFLVSGVGVIVGLLGLAAVWGLPSTAADPAAPETQAVRRFEVTGVVAGLLSDQRSVRVAHEAIPGYMPAMTMEFEARDGKEIAGLREGDRIRFRLNVEKDSGWIDRVHRISGASTNRPALASSNSIAQAKWTRPLRVGEAVADIPLTNQFGKAVRLSDYRGQALALTFIFTTCPYPEFCPRMSRNLNQAARDLASNAAVTNWHLFSVSFDPQHDSPAVLKDHGDRLKIDYQHWSLVTGESSELDLFCQSFGLYFTREGGTLVHNLVTVVLDTEGRIRKFFPGNRWKPEELTDEIIAASSLPNHASKP